MFVLAFAGLRVVLAAIRETEKRHHKNRLSRLSQSSTLETPFRRPLSGFFSHLANGDCGTESARESDGERHDVLGGTWAPR